MPRSARWACIHRALNEAAFLLWSLRGSSRVNARVCRGSAAFHNLSQPAQHIERRLILKIRGQAWELLRRVYRYPRCRRPRFVPSRPQ